MTWSESKVHSRDRVALRMRLRRGRFLVLAAVLLGLLIGGDDHARAQEAAKPSNPPGKTVRLLTVGNSFAQNATHYLGDLATAAGHKLVLRAANVGGASMALHWDKVLRYEKDPQDKKALYGAKSLQQLLEAEKFDFVTIQQASLLSHDLSTYRPYARNLYDFLKKHAPQAEVLVHQTWAYRCDDPRFIKKPIEKRQDRSSGRENRAGPQGDGIDAKKPAKPDLPATQEVMYREVNQAYKTIAAELGARILPVGDAFHLADHDPTWGYKPAQGAENRQLVYPALPDQHHSLHVGWRWRKDKKDDKDRPTLQMDGHHAGTAGEYLGACVFFEVLFGQSAVGNKFVPKGLDEAYARFLQQTAHHVVTNRQP